MAKTEQHDGDAKRVHALSHRASEGDQLFALFGLYADLLHESQQDLQSGISLSESDAFMHMMGLEFHLLETYE